MFDALYYRRRTSGNSSNDTEVPESNMTRTYVEFYVAPKSIARNNPENHL